MIFIYGGIAQNKLKFTLEKFSLSESDVFDAEKKDISYLRNEKVIYHFDRIAEKWIESDMDPLGEIVKIKDRLADRIIISNEVGCGLVPADSRERKYREAVGRINCILAEKSDTVYRVCCGLGLMLKGSEK